MLGRCNSAKRDVAWSKEEKMLLVVFLLITLILRLYYIYANPLSKLSHDELGYHRMTLQFLEKGFLGYYSDTPSAFITPGYPLFLAGVYLLAGLIGSDPLTVVRVIQVLVSVISLYLIYLITRQSGSVIAALIAVLVAGLYPPSFMANQRILTEVTYVALLLGYTYSLIRVFTFNNALWQIISGGIFGLTVLVRPAILPFLPVPYLIMLILKRDPYIIKGLIVSLVSFSLVMTPWWVRNYVVFDKFILTATQSGDPLLRGTDPYDPYDKFGQSIIKDVPHEQKTSEAINRIKRGFKNDPWLWFKWYTVGKFSFLWFKPWGVLTQWSKYLHLVFFVVLGWAGVFRNIFDQRMRWPAIIVVFFACLHQVFIPIQRYIYPLTPLMAVMASTLIAEIVQKILDTVYRNR